MVVALVISLVVNVVLIYLNYRKVNIITDIEAALANATTAIKTLTARAVAAENALKAKFELDKSKVVNEIGNIKKTL